MHAIAFRMLAIAFPMMSACTIDPTTLATNTQANATQIVELTMLLTLATFPLQIAPGWIESPQNIVLTSTPFGFASALPNSVELACV